MFIGELLMDDRGERRNASRRVVESIGRGKEMPCESRKQIVQSKDKNENKRRTKMILAFMGPVPRLSIISAVRFLHVNGTSPQSTRQLSATPFEGWI